MAYGKGGKSAVPGLNEIVQQDIKTGEFRPLYVLAGEDTLRIEMIANRIRKDALGPAGAFNDHVFDAEQTPFARIFQQAVSLPMLGGRQVIWVKHAQALLDKDENLSHFEKYVARPVAETILILSLDKADRRKKWVKACLDAGFFFEFAAPTGEALIQWIMKAAGQMDLPLEREHAQTLAELLGQDLLSIKNELDKLALLAEDSGGSLRPEQLGAVIMDQAQLQGYEITEHLEPGQAPEVLKTWFRLADWGRSAYEISPVVLNRIRRGCLLAEARDEGLGDQETAQLTGQNAWGFKFLSPMIGRMGPAGLRGALEAALDCDRRLKSSPLKEGEVFEQAILKICKNA